MTRRSGFILVAGALLAGGASAAPLDGYLKFSDQWIAAPADDVSAMLGERYRNDAHLDLRLIWAPQSGPWALLMHGDYITDHGGAVLLARQLEQSYPQLVPQDPDSVSALHLEHTLTDGTRTHSELRFDRLSAGYSGEHLTLRLGRQAVTWGTGLVFHPMDLFDPFAPTATDTEYKTGVDMAYAQWLFGDGSDLQGLTVPRRDPATGHMGAGQGSIALRYHRDDALESAWLLARDREDTVAGMSLGGPLGSSAWSTTIVPDFPQGAAARVSLVANLSDAFDWRGRPLTVFVEYYRNGFGKSGSGYAFDELPAELAARLTRGQVFVTGRDYLAGGITTDWTALLKLQATVILNVHDHGILVLPQASYSLAENTELVAIAQLPAGPHGSEFQGLHLSPGGPVYAGSPPQVYVRLAQFF